MNRFHRWYCASSRRLHDVEARLVPWTIDGVRLGDRVLEVGPGPGHTTAVLTRSLPHITAVEIDPQLAESLRSRVDASRVEVVCADATALPFPDSSFSGAVCFTMLHHVPSTALQDRLLAEVRRVLRPGATFAGCDSLPTAVFRLAHLFDTMVVVDPATLGTRLQQAGFVGVDVERKGDQVRFRGVVPGPQG